MSDNPSGAAASAALVHPSRVVGAPRSVSGHPWSGRTPASEGNRWGILRLTTTGRRTGRKRSVIIAYLEDGPNLIAMAMNGWADGEPAWWLNLQAHPDASVVLVDGPRPVRARAAKGDERSRLWGSWREIDAKLDAYAALRSSETAVVILESRPEPGQ
jgi:F420H(2)-dependent quinone reductase